MREQVARYFLTEDDFKQAEMLLADFKTAIPQKRMATTVSKSQGAGKAKQTRMERRRD